MKQARISMFAYHMRLGWPLKTKHKNALDFNFSEEKCSLLVAKEDSDHKREHKIKKWNSDLHGACASCLISEKDVQDLVEYGINYVRLGVHTTGKCLEAEIIGDKLRLKP